MKILMLTPYVPYPPNSGGQTRTFNLIKNLSKKHEITSFSFVRTDQATPDLSELKKYTVDIKTFKRNRAFSSIPNIIKTGFSLYPYLVNMYLSPEVKEAIKQEITRKKFDLIHVETYYIMPNLPATNIPILLAEQTIEYLVYQHYAETTKLFFTKPLLYIDVAKHKYWEKYYWEKAKKVVAMSNADRKRMLGLSPNLDVDTVPNGVDQEWFSQKLKKKIRNYPRFLFVGQFNWLQNIEAATILVNDIWPSIKVQLPSAKLWIVGRNPTDRIKNLAGEGIEVSDDIEDIRVAYQNSDVLIAPLFGGGGTRYKTLEAMASHLPVVSTEIGVEGLGIINGVHALVSNDKNQLADLSVKLANDQKLQNNIAKSAFKLVSEKFDWLKISDKLEKIYEQTAAFHNHS